MLVTCLPGVQRHAVLEALDYVHTGVSNLRTGASGDATEQLAAYLDWASMAANKLRSVISTADIDRLVLTKRFDALLAAVGGFGAQIAQRGLSQLVQTEVAQRADELHATMRAIQDRVTRLHMRGKLVVFDTTVYIEHTEHFGELDFDTLVKPDDQPVHLFVPIAVVDELDDMKEVKGNDHARWRGRVALSVLDSTFEDPLKPALLRKRDRAAIVSGSLRGEVSAEILFDPPGHVRLSIPDDEIIDRVLVVQAYADCPITLYTYDTGQSTRARAAGLQVRKLTHPVGDEPEKTRKPKKQRREGGAEPAAEG